MVNHQPAQLDAVFSALADTTRRGILAALTVGEKSVTELAQPFSMSLPGFMKHLRILEDANLLKRQKSGRVVNCSLAAAAMKDAANWLARYEEFWEQRLDALSRYLEKEDSPCPKSSKTLRLRSSARSKRRRKKSGARLRSRKH